MIAVQTKQVFRCACIRLATLLVIALALSVPASFALEMRAPAEFADDPIAVVNIFIGALKAERLDAALGLIAEDVVFVDSDGAMRHGRAAVRDWLNARLYRGEYFQFSDIWLSGNEIEWTIHTPSGNSLCGDKCHAVIEKGRIVYLRV